LLFLPGARAFQVTDENRNKKRAEPPSRECTQRDSDSKRNKEALPAVICRSGQSANRETGESSGRSLKQTAPDIPLCDFCLQHLDDENKATDHVCIGCVEGLFAHPENELFLDRHFNLVWDRPFTWPIPQPPPLVERQRGFCF